MFKLLFETIMYATAKSVQCATYTKEKFLAQ